MNFSRETNKFNEWLKAKPSKRSLLDVIQVSDIPRLIQNNQKEIFDFVKNRFKEIVDGALNADEKLSNRKQYKYAVLLQCYAEKMPKECCDDEYMLSTFHTMLDNPNIKEHSLICICEVILSIIKSQNHESITILSSHDSFIDVFIKNINHASIYECIRKASIQNSRVSSEFFDSIKFAEKLFNQIKAEKNERLIQILANICSNVPASSWTIEYMSSNDILDYFLNVVYETDDKKLASACFGLFSALFMQVEYVGSTIDSYSSEYDDSLPELTDFFDTRYNRIASYAMTNRPFECDKGSCIKLVSRLIPFIKEPSSTTTHLLDYLFELTMSHPCISMIHNAFLSIFDACRNNGISIDDFDRRCSARERIARVFKKRSYMLANFWGHLLIVAEAFVEKEGITQMSSSSEEDAKSSDDEEESSKIKIPEPPKVTFGFGDTIPGKDDEVIDSEGIFTDQISDLILFDNEKNDTVVLSPVESPTRSYPNFIMPRSFPDDSLLSISSTESSIDEKLTNDTLQFPKPDLPASLPKIGPPPPIPTLPPMVLSPASSLRAKSRILSPPPEDDEKEPWPKFIKGTYKTLTKIISKEYGGPLPGTTHTDIFDLGSSDDEL